jgi:hypothetical protein
MQAIYPYDTLFGELGLNVANVEVDGQSPPKDLRDSQFRLVNPYLLEAEGWRELTLELNVEAPADEIALLDEHGREPKVTVVAFCRKTNARQAVGLERSRLDSSRWTGKIELARDNFREKVTVDAVLTATADEVPFRRIGMSDPWQIYFDEPTVPPIEGTLRVTWAHFKGEEREEVIPEHAADEAFYIALEERPPIVFLNRDFRGLPGLLSDDRGRPAAEIALRDAEYRRIASAAWSEIFNVSVANVRLPEEDGAEPEWPEEEWQQQALRSLLPRIYPHLTEAERLTQAHNDARGDGALMLQALSQIAVAQEIGAGRSLRRNLDRLNATGAN